MVKRKTPQEPTPRRQRAYELPNLVNIQVPMDPIRQIEREALADLSNEYRTLRIEELISKKKRQLEKASPSSDISLQKQNLDLVSTIFRLAKDLQPQQGKDDTLQYVTLFKDLMLESAKLQNQGGRSPSFFESIITDPHLYERTQNIFGSGKTGATNTSDIEIEKLKGERMLNSKRIDLELHKMRLQSEMDRDKIGMLASILGPLAAYGGNQMAQSMKQMGVDTVNRYRGKGNPSPEVEMLRELSGETAKMEISCSCGFNEAMLVPVPPPATLSCPGCGKPLQIEEAPPTNDSEYKVQWMQKT